MKIRVLVLFTFAISLLAACSTTRLLNTNYEKGVDFTAFKTYQLLKHKNDFPFGMNPINRQLIEKAIQKEMTNLGYQVSKEPDLVVAFFVKEKTIREVSHYYRGYYGRWGYPSWIEVNEYQEGTLVIDLIDRTKKQVIWHGAAEGRVYDDMKNVEKEINETVEAVFKKYAKDSEWTGVLAGR